MVGGIYSDEKCPICGEKYQDNGNALICPTHKKQKAQRFRVKFKGIYRRFSTYDTAYRFLSGLRFKYDEGTFDKRDYQSENPLGFTNLIRKWLQVKEKTVKRKSFNNLKSYSERAIKFFGNTNVKEIAYAPLEDFLYSQNVSDKTRANIKSALHDFWTWMLDRQEITIAQFPKFPRCSFELGFRKTISREEQEAILNEIYKISYHINPKIYLGIKWLCTYISIRPGEMIRLKEGEIDLSNGYLFFPHPKEKKPKTVPILDDDINILKSFPKGLPSLPFFRHTGGIQGTKEGKPFGEKYFYKWWVKACENLGIEGVDLYGGTRHSTAKALRQVYSPEQIKRATMHSTNKAFERYFQIEADDLREIYQTSQAGTSGTKLAPKKEPTGSGKLLKFKDVFGGGGGS